MHQRSKLPGTLLIAGLAFIAHAGMIEAQPSREVPAMSPKDSAKRYDGIKRTIREFQDQWRAEWKKSEEEEHGVINLVQVLGNPGVPGDLELKNWTTDVRRYLSINCFINSPNSEGAALRSRIGGGRNVFRGGMGAVTQPPAVLNEAAGVSWVTWRQITPQPNMGPVCPQWVPPDEGIPPDEGESIDLALKQSRRLPAQRAREALITKLDEAQKKSPTDEWIAGQRVRFVYDQDDPERTLVTAQSCQLKTSWCSSLLGLAQFQNNDLVAAESAFRRADSLEARARVATAPCFEPSILLVLKPGDRSKIESAPCQRQETLINQLWWLSDPLWSVTGNERYVEQSVRKIHLALRSVDDRDERYVWWDKGGGDAMRELITRYGWPTHTFWANLQMEEILDKYLDATRLPPRFRARPYSVKEYSPDRVALVPEVDAIINPFRADSSHWNLYRPAGTSNDNWWPQEHSNYLTPIAPLNGGQQAVWRRDSTISYQLAVDDPLRNLSATTATPSKAVLMGGEDPSKTRVFSEWMVAEGMTLRLPAQLPAHPVVLSAEILPRVEREQALRKRFGFTPPPTLRQMKDNEFAISEPVFLRMTNRTMPLPADEAGVLRYMAGTLAFPADEFLALYWESYGFIPGDTVEFDLKFKRVDDRSALRVLGSALGVVSGQRDSISIKWTEPDARHSSNVMGGSKPTVGRTLAVDLKGLPPGDFVVSIEMRKNANVAARSERRFQIIKTPQ